jgi:hypothetical protein
VHSGVTAAILQEHNFPSTIIGAALPAPVAVDPDRNFAVPVLSHI